jgi:hypothetical protein
LGWSWAADVPYSLDILAKSRMTLIETAEGEEVTLTAITA